MSNHWGLACLSHDPPILMQHPGAENGLLNHGREAIIDAVVKVRSGTWPWRRDVVWDADVPDPVVGSTGATSRAHIYFLNDHPHCRVAVFSEYGEAWTLDDGPLQVTGTDGRRSYKPIRRPDGDGYDREYGVYPPEGETECACPLAAPAVTVSEWLRTGMWVRCARCHGLLLTEALAGAA